jgi:pimeloyl-ACP methyl ester carboxylesterase
VDVVLVPGMWLDASSWDVVGAALEQRGFRVHALTLPGLEARDADRSGIGLPDHVAAVVGAIDAVDPGRGGVLVVGHSAGAGIAYAAVDARPDRVARAVYIGGFPTAAGDPLTEGFTAEHDEIPLPPWSDFGEEELAGLDEAARDAFRRRAIPFPEAVIKGPQRLGDERRYQVPVTMICTEFTSAAVREWVEAGAPPVRELARIQHVEYVDLPTGHWPQFSRPRDLAGVLARTASG